MAASDIGSDTIEVRRVSSWRAARSAPGSGEPGTNIFQLVPDDGAAEAVLALTTTTGRAKRSIDATRAVASADVVGDGPLHAPDRRDLTGGGLGGWASRVDPGVMILGSEARTVALW